MNKSRKRKHLFTVLLIILSAVFFVIIGMVSMVTVNRILDENVSRRAVAELRTVVDEQKRLIEREIERQFIPLRFLSAYFEDQHDFLSADHRDMIHILMETNKWCTVGYADLNGDAVSYEGESLGNIRQRSYFQRIADGSSDHQVEFLSSTNMVAEPRFLFAVPILCNQEIQAVLFVSKEISVMEPVLLANYTTGKNAAVTVASGDGTVLCANSIAQSGVYTDIHASSPVGIQDWEVIASADRKTLEIQYEANLSSIRMHVGLMMGAFGALLLCIVLSSSLFMRKLSRKEQDYQFEKYRNDIVMKEMGCEIFVYDIHSRMLTTEGILHEKYGIDFAAPLNTIIQKQKNIHPECDFERIKRAFDRTVRTYKKQDLVFMLSFEKEIRWIRMTLMPYSADNKKTTHVLGSFLNVSSEHTEFGKNAEMLMNMPGGFHRCYLSDPIHVEYISNGLSEMLGYTDEELMKVMREGDYTQAIYAEDRDKFEAFVARLAEKPGVEVCEYRMIRKDGRLVSVSDTMESILAATGIMYGYSVVYDVSSFAAEIETLTGELQEARVKNSLSQMQPHFLYNTLASIREIVLEDPEYASELILDFTTHLRACIKAMSSNDLVPFRSEMENIQAYVNIEKMRFGDKLKVEYQIEQDDFLIVPLSIQPLVENAIRHGIYQRGARGGTVTISSRRDENGYRINVRDDGIGFDYAKVRKEVESGQRDSTGISSLVFRLEKMLNARVEIDSHENVGTDITVIIPVSGVICKKGETL